MKLVMDSTAMSLLLRMIPNTPGRFTRSINKPAKILWERIAYEGLPKVKRHPKSTHADSTPVTDGKYLVVLFGSHGLYAYNLNGKLLWKQDLGVLDAGWFYDADYQWEHGSSPVIYRDLVIIQADVQKDSFIAAYSLKNWEAGLENSARGNFFMGHADSLCGPHAR